MKRKVSDMLIICGILLMLAAVGMVFHHTQREEQVSEKTEVVVAELVELIQERAPVPQADPTTENVNGVSYETSYSEVLPDYVLNPEMPMPTEAVDGYDYVAVMRVPALDLELPIIRGWDYTKLQESPCSYRGSVYTRNFVVCAHNYDCHFGRIYMLVPGDEVTLTDMNGNVFTYEVVEQTVLPPDADEQICSGEYDFTFFTCTLGGASRVTVFCRMV